MTWAQIRKLYLQGAGDQEAAREEAYTHLSQGYRDVATDPRVNVPELMAIDTSVAVSSGADSVAVSTIDFSTFAIANVFNVTDGYPIYPEPGGMIGRQQYLEVTTGRPPSGKVTHYMRDGSSLFVRNTPDATTTLQIRVMRQVPDLTDADINGSPLTPPQYDMAIVHAAVASYYALHPGPTGEGSEGRTLTLAQKHRAEVERILTDRRQPAAVEDHARMEVVRLRGYRPSPRTRMGR